MRQACSFFSLVHNLILRVETCQVTELHLNFISFKKSDLDYKTLLQQLLQYGLFDLKIHSI